MVHRWSRPPRLNKKGLFKCERECVCVCVCVCVDGWIHPNYLLQVRWNAKDLLSIGPPFISLDFTKSRVISAVKLAELHVSHEIFML
jgi:hypothetical protein